MRFSDTLFALIQTDAMCDRVRRLLEGDPPDLTTETSTRSARTANAIAAGVHGSMVSFNHHGVA